MWRSEKFCRCANLCCSILFLQLSHCCSTAQLCEPHFRHAVMCSRRCTVSPCECRCASGSASGSDRHTVANARAGAQAREHCAAAAAATAHATLALKRLYWPFAVPKRPAVLAAACLPPSVGARSQLCVVYPLSLSIRFSLQLPLQLCSLPPFNNCRSAVGRRRFDRILFQLKSALVFAHVRFKFGAWLCCFRSFGFKFFFFFSSQSALRLCAAVVLCAWIFRFNLCAGLPKLQLQHLHPR